MQSENGILLLFYICLSHGNEKKKMKKGGMLCPIHKHLCTNLDTFSFKRVHQIQNGHGCLLLNHGYVWLFGHCHIKTHANITGARS